MYARALLTRTYKSGEAAKAPKADCKFPFDKKTSKSTVWNGMCNSAWIRDPAIPNKNLYFTVRIAGGGSVNTGWATLTQYKKKKKNLIGVIIRTLKSFHFKKHKRVDIFSYIGLHEFKVGFQIASVTPYLRNILLYIYIITS